MGLFVCLLMIMLDTKPNPPSTGSALRASEQEAPGQRPLKQLQKALVGDAGDGKLYPVNVTGRYQGDWKSIPFSKPLRSPPHNDSKTPASSSAFRIKDTKGSLIMQVNMSPLPGLDELSLVSGYYQLVGRKRNDPLGEQHTGPVQGVFFRKYGRVTLVSSPERIFLRGQNASRPVRKERARAAVAGRRLAEELVRQLDMDGSSSSSSPHSHSRAMLQNEQVHAALGSALNEGGEDGLGTDPRDVRPPAPRRMESSGSREGPADLPPIATSLGANIKLLFGSQEPSDSWLQIGQGLGPSASSRPKAHGNGLACQFLFDLEAPPVCTSPAQCSKRDRQNSWAMALNGKITSENCQVALNVTTDAFRIDWEKASPRAIVYGVFMVAVCLAQIVVLLKQLHYSDTQSAAARVSLLCIGHQAVMDALICIVHLLLCAFIPQLFTVAATVSFLKLIVFIIIEMRYIVVISHARNPQLFAGGVNQLRHEFAVLHLRFYAALFGAVAIMYWMRRYLDILIMIAYSYWVPQIVCNAVRDTRRPLHPVYVSGMSISRLILPLYLYGVPANLAAALTGTHMTARLDMCLLLIAWTAIQVWILRTQDKKGPRFMIPARFLPPKYDYERPPPPNLAQQAMDLGGEVECIICYQPIRVPTHLARSHGTPCTYMITPCDHIFHRECLERWMQQKMECPVCRSALPAHEEHE